MFSPQQFILHKQTLWLSPARCIFWEEEKALILSDLHFGKTGHFRKSGIGVPQNIFKDDLQTLFAQIRFFNPSQLLIVGDMFHSRANKEIDFFLKWRKDIADISIHLIKGNHDVLTDKFYEEANITVTKKKLSVKKFCFTHDIETNCHDDEPQNTIFTFSGHVHPGIVMNGTGKQALRFPCFYFSKDYAILPAFSQFTGLSKIRPKPTDTVFVLVENKVVKLQ
ncbi:MAG: ligase-associated DNA damage response endonuclease PdeM [Ginsengibacter sp.]